MTGMRLELVPVADDEQLGVLEHLVSGDQRGAAEFGGFYGRALTRLAPLLGPDRRVWLMEVDGVVVGFLDADNDAGRVGLAYFVTAAFRGQGVAKRAVAQILAAGVWPGAALYTATIADGNVASIGVARATGFRLVGKNEDGEGVWERHVAQGSFRDTGAT
jgi:GNAT superfamily N-acetyltransferase